MSYVFSLNIVIFHKRRLENVVDCVLSNSNPIQSEQTDKALDKIQKGMGFYKHFLATK
ncbi:MAG TPA: hypothetical protein VJU13_04905 [Candidatus Nitrosocosmicus sp.]|nr:hypothetical protein [Candidatus Nitrosocosmicus sp.]